MEYIINSSQTPVISHYANYIVYNPDTQQASLILPTGATKITLNSMLNFAKQIKKQQRNILQQTLNFCFVSMDVLLNLMMLLGILLVVR